MLKVKLAGAGDPERLAAVRAAAPDAELIVDANEAWRPEDLEGIFRRLRGGRAWRWSNSRCRPATMRRWRRKRPVPVCADESVHDRAGLAALRDRYDLVNIKLDKTGGLTEALALADEARKARASACSSAAWSASSLAMAPALLLAPRAQFVDLDGPLLLARDRPHGLRYEGSIGVSAGARPVGMTSDGRRSDILIV